VREVFSRTFYYVNTAINCSNLLQLIAVLEKILGADILVFMEKEQIKGHLILLMAPSGSGKKKVMEGLGKVADDIYFAKTYTNRERREGVEENSRYTFISREDFEEAIDKGELIEWAVFSGNYYGTPRSELIVPLSEGRIVMKEMELQGVQQIKKLIPEENITVIYIDAGSWENLRKRILARAPMSEEHLALRKERYEEESKFKDEADVVIDNHNGKLDVAQSTFRKVVEEIINKHHD